MKTLMGFALMGTLLLGSLAGSPAQAKTTAKAAAPSCPACKMPLATKMSKATPTAVKIAGKTYYCCSKCDMSKAKK
jgi:YHS domain-containing protein